MGTEAEDGNAEVESAIEQVRLALRQRIRAEQLRDRLTGLANDEALTEWLNQNVENGTDFWLAFVEVDRFKNVNDEFGYADADVLLGRVSAQLRNAAQTFFGSGATPFRAHGDEFFIGGGMQSEEEQAHLEGPLDLLRENIAAISVNTTRGKMKCTVSVGWLTSKLARESELGLSERSVRRQLELAVQEAKVERNCVVCFSNALAEKKVREGRSDCGACQAKFALSVPCSDSRVEQLFCPNCGERLSRPVGLVPAEDAASE